MERKKESEHIILNYFFEKYSGTPTGKLEKTESPDFVLWTKRKYGIGIELTRMVIEKPNPDFADISRAMLKTIEKKNSKLRLYQRKKLNAYWLLMTIEDMPTEKKRKFDEYLGRIEIASGFNSIFLFELFEGSIYQIK